MTEYTKKMIEWKIPDYTESLKLMSDEDLVYEVFSMVLMDARAARYCVWSAKCNKTYDECVRREKIWLYSKGWNEAFESQGHEVTAEMRASEKPTAA